jgi:carbon-monoxide dehydrogenase medium subunit
MYPTRPAQFDYHRPSTLEEAVELLGTLEDARPLAGGHSLIPAMKLRIATPLALVDIGRLPGLDGVEADGDGIRIGALTRHAVVAQSALVRECCPALAEAAALIGDRQVRNRGTIGGSLAHADPGADYPTAITALAATVSVLGPAGTRTIPADEFFTGVFSTALQRGELVTSVHLPASPAGTGSAYVKHKHPASGYAVAAVAAVVSLDGDACTAARLVVGGVTGVPARADAAAASLIGSNGSTDTVAAAAAKVPKALGDALGDVYASADYRRHLATVLAGRAVTAAFGRASD